MLAYSHELDLFLVGALAEVLELGLAAQKAVLQLGFFGGQLVALGRDRLQALRPDRIRRSSSASADRFSTGSALTVLD